MFRRLHNNPAAVIETFAPGASANLMKIARAQNGGLLAIVLAEFREKHCSDRNVDADSECIGAGNDLKQSLLRQLLHQHTIFWEQTGMMQSNPVPQPFFDLRSVRAAELEALQGARDSALFLARADIDAGEILRALRRFQLREMNYVNRSFASGRQCFECLSQSGLGV